MPYKCTIRTVAGRQFGLGEGPHYDEVTRRLYFVDLANGDFYCYDETTQKLEQKHIDGHATLIVPYKSDSNKFVVSTGQSLAELDWTQGTTKPLATLQDKPSMVFNDGKCDVKGRLWAGTLDRKLMSGGTDLDDGSLYKLSDRKFTHHLDGIKLSNGLTWSLDNKVMYFCDTTAREVWAFDYDLDQATISNKQIIFDFKGQPGFNDKEGPDGMTIDNDGNLWVCSYDGGRVYHINPRTSKLINWIEMPTNQPTSLCWAGEGRFYVTSGRAFSEQSDLARFPESGSLFEVQLDQNLTGPKCEPFTA